MTQVLYARSKLKRVEENYELEVDAAGDRLHGIVCEVRTLEILLNGGLERADDCADVGG